MNWRHCRWCEVSSQEGTWLPTLPAASVNWGGRSGDSLAAPQKLSLEPLPDPGRPWLGCVRGGGNPCAEKTTSWTSTVVLRGGRKSGTAQASVRGRTGQQDVMRGGLSWAMKGWSGTRAPRCILNTAGVRHQTQVYVL